MDSASEWGALRITLLFGGRGGAGAHRGSSARRPGFRQAAGGVDPMSTGSIGRGEAYTIRRSVLQSSPDAVCVIRSDGARSGDC